MIETPILIGTLFLLGAAHALEPGHGKLLVTSYLTGSQAKIRDAFLLGGLTAVVHTLSVALLGAVVVSLALTFFKDSFTSSLEILSGVVILALGALLFWRRFLKKSDHAHQCDCHVVHEKPLEEEPMQRPNASLKEVVLLGLASGITPCPMALAALIAAFSFGKVPSAILALTVFSAGIGSVLVILGILMIRGAARLESRWVRFKNAPVMIARVSTVIVLLLGCYLVSKPLFFPETEQAHAEESNPLMMLNFE